MKISLEWLSEFITWTETDPQIIADRLTLCTAEVEEIEEQGALLRDCCVGKILQLSKHPDADRLSVVEVETDRGKKTIVCGGTNLREGMLVAVAHPGATVRHGAELVKLQLVKIRGVQSEGMLCAAEELDLAELFPTRPEDGERPVIDLEKCEMRNAKCEMGAPLREVLGLTDTVLTINNTAITMRPDLFSHLGIARECVAIGLATWKKKPVFKASPFPDEASAITLHVDAPDLVPRYLACTLSLTGMGETPQWMKRRLEAVGWRSITLPVDITNYVATEIGVPLHSFDMDDIRGDVHLRLSTKGERITTLDDVERVLPDGALVLSDDAGVFDLLGIIGGLRSSTTERTRHIYLHAASLDPTTIRKTILATGHRTDAATVYEKGVPPISAEWGFFRALQLFLDLVPGARITSSLDTKGGNGVPVSSTLSLDAVRATLGADIPGTTIEGILTDLGCTVRKSKTRGVWSVLPPLWRLRDLTGAHDFIEEVGRVYGFDGIEGRMPVAEVRLSKRDHRLHHFRDALRAEGFFELVPLSFLSAAHLASCELPPEDAITVHNPLGADTRYLQPSTLPRLLEHAADNLPRADGDLLTFQWGHVFSRSVPEHMELGLLLTAAEETTLLRDPFLRLKAHLEAAFSCIGISISVQKNAHPSPHMHPGRSAHLLLGQTVVGHLFELHPIVRERTGLPFRSAAAQIDCTLLLAISPAAVTAQSVPAFPSVTYDVTVPRTQREPLHDLLHRLHRGSDLLENVSVQDLYALKHTYDPYQLTLRFVFRAPDRTLTEEEAKREHEKVLKAGGIGNG